MLNQKQIEEIREHLEKAQNPLFLFDNDQDGLCSFLLLQRYIGRGKGVAVKSYPGLDESYFRKANELNADYIFILDKPVVSKEFFKEVEQVNLPVVWIDHHEVQDKIPEFVNYYNPLPKSNEPVTALCYDITKRKEDLWLAIVGAISDRFLPDFYEDFKKKYPELSIDSNDAFEVFYKSEIGKVARILAAGLKDRTTNVIKMQKFLMNASSPHEVLDENKNNFLMHKRFNEISGKLNKLKEKALSESQEGNLFYFEYGGDTSLSGDLANEFMFMFPEKIVAVAYITGIKANISGRGKDVKKIFMKAIEGLKGARGGGHDVAVGVQIHTDSLEEFKKRLKAFV
jgi:single-stranded DNA-specific DHH superfamily exonuclease